MNKDAFASCHPLVNFLYFALVLLFTAFFMHPVSLAVSLVSALGYAGYLHGRKAARFSLRFLLPMMLLAALTTPAFSHEGATVLTYLPSGNPLTLESILCGIASAVMLAAAVTWFSCFSTVMSSDKFVYLFGRAAPALSLVLSMTLRFVPKFKSQFRTLSEAQRCVGRNVREGSVWARGKKAAAVFSAMVTWSFENAIETADSMKSRGYGLPNRSAFSIYRFDDRDRALLGFLAFCAFYVFAGWLYGALDWRYYPTLGGAPSGAFPLSFQLVYLALCLTPLILNGMEDRKWKRLRSEI